MIDDQTAQSVPVGNQDAPMPSAEQVPSEVSTQPSVAPQEVAPVAEEPRLPEGASERTTENFERLRNQLREERQKREYMESVFNSMNQPKAQEAPSTPLYDPSTGLVNETVFAEVDKRAREAEARATRAEASVQNYLRQQEEQEAFVAHPELKPGTMKFDEKLHNITRGILTDSMLNPQNYGGKQISFKEAADLAKGYAKPALEKAQQQGAKQALESLSPKEQAALEATGSATRRTEVNSPLPDLQYKTRKGDVSSIIERLKGVPMS